MENDNVNWGIEEPYQPTQPTPTNDNIDWGSSEETVQSNEPDEIPSFNWEEPTNEPDEIPSFNWEEPIDPLDTNVGEHQNPNPHIESSSDPDLIQKDLNTKDNIINPNDIANSKLERDFNYIGNIPSLSVNTKLWKVNVDNNEILSKDIDLNKLDSIDNESKFKLNLQPENSLSNLLLSISKTGLNSGLKLNNAFLYRVKPNESTLNIFKGNPKTHFIYFLQADYNSGEILLDLSAINGPTVKTLDSTPGILIMFDGWVPYRISKNISKKDLIAIAGTFI